MLALALLLVGLLSLAGTAVAEDGDITYVCHNEYRVARIEVEGQRGVSSIFLDYTLSEEICQWDDPLIHYPHPTNLRYIGYDPLGFDPITGFDCEEVNAPVWEMRSRSSRGNPYFTVQMLPETAEALCGFEYESGSSLPESYIDLPEVEFENQTCERRRIFRAGVEYFQDEHCVVTRVDG